MPWYGEPLIEWTPDELAARVRKMHEAGNQVHAPNDFTDRWIVSVELCRLDFVVSTVSESQRDGADGF
jgi:hypothetical protein